MLTQVQKLKLLTMLNEHKEKLTAKFSSPADGKKKKLAIWNSLYSQMEAIGYKGSMEKLRDVEYQNIRKATMKKRDAAMKSGEGKK